MGEDLRDAYLTRRTSIEGNDLLEWANSLRGTDTTGMPQAATEPGTAPEANAPVVLPQVPRPEEIGRVTKTVAGAVGKDLLMGVVETPHALVGGVADALRETADAAKSLAAWSKDKDFLALVEGGPVQLGDQIVDTSLPKVNIPQVSPEKSVTGGLVRETARWLTGFIPALKGAKLLGLAGKLGAVGSVAESSLAGALASSTVFGPQEERLSNLIQEFPALQNPVTDYLQARPGDGEAEGRFKAALEGLGLGAVMDGAVAALKVMRGARAARAAGGSPTGGGTIDGTGQPRIGGAAVGEPQINLEALGDNTRPLVQVAKPIRAEALAGKLGKGASRAQDFMQLTIGDTPERAVNVNLARIQSTDDVKQTLAKMGEVFAPEIDEARRGVVSNKETERLAGLVNMTPETLLARRKGQAFNAHEALAARRLMVASADNLTRVAQVAASPNASEVDLLAFRKAMAVQYVIQEQVSGMTAEAGRALQSFNISAVGTEGKARAVRDLLQSSGGADFSRNMAAMLAGMNSPEQVAAFVGKASRATTTDMLLEAWINGLLTNPVTHAANTISNGIVALWAVPERMLAAGIGKAMGTEGGVASGEAVAQAYGLIQGMKDGFRLAARSMATGETSDMWGKVETRYHSISGENLNLSGTAGRAVDLLGEVVRSPGRALGAEDEFFKSIGYRMELNALAFRTATSEGLQGEALGRRIADIVANPPESLSLAATDAARYQTFTKELGTFGSAISKAASSHPALRIVIPFVRTPINIFNYSIERTPYAVLTRAFRDDVAAGGARRDLALARISLGTMTAGVVSEMVATGSITGGGPKEPALRQSLENQGWQPYSFKIGDSYFSYQRMEPLGSVIGLAADAAELMAHSSEADGAQLAGATMLAFAHNLTSKTFLQGLSQAMDIIQSGDENKGKRYFERLAGSVVPAGVAAVNRVYFDPEKKNADGLIEAIRARTPGFSTDIPPRRNLWGDVIPYSPSLGPDIVSPIYVSHAKESPVDAELTRLELSISMPKKQWYGVAEAGGRQFEPVQLTPKEYDRYVQLAGNEWKAPGSRLGLRDALENLIMTPNYKRGSDGPDGGKALMIRALVNGYRDGARAELLKEFPDLKNTVYERMAGKAAAMRLTP